MTAQAFEFDGPRGYRLASRLELSDDQPAAALVGRGTFNVLQWTDMPHGGHFAALEQPALLAEDLRRCFRPLRS
ncbi:hypothetical protein BN2476_500117 [Paraburkholderia piptadeniae]|uniref:Epoxide hydrolase n=1 Tax=Paraburkholderia piptadeniae TaxID=1701573 RepID=A0A1N7SFW2_9BURK|nr:hypothetical protein BN2476_500117 [Paraburkholderia piptadeniae]